MSVQHRQLRDVEARHEHPPPRYDGDELLARETLQRLTNGCASDAELALQIVLAHDGAGREIEPDDHPADLLIGLLAQGNAHVDL